MVPDTCSLCWCNRPSNRASRLGCFADLVLRPAVRSPKPRHLYLVAGVPIDQELKPNLPLTVSWTGDTVFDGAPSVPKASQDLAQVYDSMNATLFFQQFINLIFAPLDSLV
jgi:hypothetical protein